MNIKETYHSNGERKSIEFYNSEGRLNRIDKPAVKFWYDNGQKEIESYYVNGKLHNENGPAFITWYVNGQKEREEYYIKGNHHNENGPAEITWHNNGKKAREAYYIDGKGITKEKFLQLTPWKPVEEAISPSTNKESANTFTEKSSIEETVSPFTNKESVNTFTEKYPNGTVKNITYKNKEGEIHNIEGGAIIHYDKEGNKVLEEHCVYGELLYRRKVFDDKPIVSSNRVVMSLLNNRIVMSCLRALAQ